MPSSAGASALARITTASTSLTPAGSRAAPGLRPWRGSQLDDLLDGYRQQFGSAGASALARITTGSPPSSWNPGRGSAGASALARITTLRPGSIPGRALAAPGLRPWRGSQRLPGRGRRPGPEAAAPGLRPWRGSQHLSLQVRGEPGQRSAGASALARITTPTRSRSGCGRFTRSAGASALARITTPGRCSGCRRNTGQRRGFGPGEDHNTQITGGTPPCGCLP